MMARLSEVTSAPQYRTSRASNPRSLRYRIRPSSSSRRAFRPSSFTLCEKPRDLIEMKFSSGVPEERSREFLIESVCALCVPAEAEQLEERRLLVLPLPEVGAGAAGAGAALAHLHRATTGSDAAEDRRSQDSCRLASRDLARGVTWTSIPSVLKSTSCTPPRRPTCSEPQKPIERRNSRLQYCLTPRAAG